MKILLQSVWTLNGYWFNIIGPFSNYCPAYGFLPQSLFTSSGLLKCSILICILGFSWVSDYYFPDSTVTALDRAYAEDAVLPLPKILDVHEKKNRHQTLITDPGEVMADSLDSKSQPKFVESKGRFMSNY